MLILLVKNRCVCVCVCVGGWGEGGGFNGQNLLRVTKLIYQESLNGLNSDYLKLKT